MLVSRRQSKICSEHNNGCFVGDVFIKELFDGGYFQYPDLSPIDFLWVYLKGKSFENNSQNIDELKPKITNNIATI